MKHYIVGGAVRDRLLGLPVKDRDWVVVGATPEDMLAQGFRPVGKDFPVFLHPQTREEYALARTERKSGRGYHGFVFHAAPDVTLEQDLVRRDLTINAIAQDQDGSLIDPHGGRADLKAGLLRHVSPAFAEDPVRILRVARFAARFGFAVAAETQQLMCDMVAAGEVDALVAERVWQELAKGLMCAQPSTMLHVLRRCGALVRLLPELDALFAAGDDGVGSWRALDAAAACGQPLTVRFAALMHALAPDALLAMCERLRVPGDCRDLTRTTATCLPQLAQLQQLDADAVLRLLRDCDALRRPERAAQMLATCDAIAAARQQQWPQSGWLTQMLAAAQAVDAGSVARDCARPRDIPQAVELARSAAIAACRQQLFAGAAAP